MKTLRFNASPLLPDADRWPLLSVAFAFLVVVTWSGHPPKSTKGFWQACKTCRSTAPT